MPTNVFPNPNQLPDVPYYDNMFSACLIDNNDGTFSVQTTGGGGGGSATANNQLTQIGLETTTADNTTTLVDKAGDIITAIDNIANIVATLTIGYSPLIMLEKLIPNGTTDNIPANSIVLAVLQKTSGGTYSINTNWNTYAGGAGSHRTISSFERLLIFSGTTLTPLTLISSFSNVSGYFLQNEFANNNLQLIINNTSGNDLYFFYVTQSV